MIFRIWPDFGLIWSDLVFFGFDLNRSESYVTRFLTDLIWSDLIGSVLFRIWSESIWSDWWLTWSDLKWSDNLNAQNFYNFNNFREENEYFTERWYQIELCNITIYAIIYKRIKMESILLFDNKDQKIHYFFLMKLNEVNGFVLSIYMHFSLNVKK